MTEPRSRKRILRMVASPAPRMEDEKGDQEQNGNYSKQTVGKLGSKGKVSGSIDVFGS